MQQLLYHTNVSFNTNVIQLSMAVLPAYYLVHIYGSVLTATGRLKPFIGILALSVAINLVLNVVLIPSYGAVGCTIAALASQYTCAVSCYFIATRACNLTDSPRVWIAYVAGAAVFFLILLALKSFINNVWLILAFLLVLVTAIAVTQQKNVKLIARSFIQ
ncbi:MAG: hypothetical protein EON98_10130 [Chitinophagaceae bacterium]|nr:MAG: hypothetical protein EON98_10130 [Chitinophagaceae bacterium]